MASPRNIVIKEGEIYTDVDFETAITLTGFGKFNILILLISIPACFACMMQTTTMSYVVPAAHCDLGMTLKQRGLLNGIIFLGMIFTAYLWGYLSDTFGRKKTIVIAYMLDVLFAIITSLSQTYGMLLSIKFISGLIIQGPFSLILAIVSEFHCAKYRAKSLIVVGTFFCLSNVVLPLVAWAVLPRQLDVELLNGKFKMHSWNFFLLICSVPSIMNCILQSSLPESPKFLMTMGRNEEALQVFRKVYSWNSGKPADTYPVKSLIEETKLEPIGAHNVAITANRKNVQAVKEGCQQIKPLCFPPLVSNFVLVCVLQTGILTGMNTLRLWLPQLLTVINDHPSGNASLCEMMEKERSKPIVSSGPCVVNKDSSYVYVNSCIVASVSIVSHLFIGVLINILGKKKILVGLGVVSGISAFGIYFSRDSTTPIALAAITIALNAVNGHVVVSVMVDLFPTTLRTMTISLNLMLGRAGSMVGSVLFPFLLDLGCFAPFGFVSFVTISCGLLSLLLPNTDLKALI